MFNLFRKRNAIHPVFSEVEVLKDILFDEEFEFKKMSKSYEVNLRRFINSAPTMEDVRKLRKEYKKLVQKEILVQTLKQRIISLAG